jgi:23S rRNA pseudouridine2604 synthase
MATLKLRKPAAPAGAPASPKRAPLRGGALRPRPTLAEAQALRTERNAPTREPPQRRRAEPANAHGADPPPVRRARPPAAGASRHSDGSLRLSKRMSELGIASRREADEWIAKGWVRVDGRVVSELGSRVVPGQHISVDAKARRQQAGRVTVLLNKPMGYVSGQAEDGYEPAIVLVTPQNQWREDRSGMHFVREHLRSLVPAGRLDIDSVGLLVLTQDGRIAKQLIGEESGVEKEYLVRVATTAGATLASDKLGLLCHGLELDGEALRPAQVEWINNDQLRFVLTQGKKRQIRRMCEAVGLQVLGLKRVRIGSVVLGDLPPGRWRYLRADEALAPAAVQRGAAPASSA